MIKRTQEQQAIVAWDLQPGQTLKIMAFAGTGQFSIRLLLNNLFVRSIAQ
jgi:hypothetical protein